MLRRLLAPLVVLALAVLALGDPPEPKPAAAPPTVYRIGKGTHYHLATCPECKKKGAKVAAITPAQAEARNLTPCLKCDPPPLAALALAPGPAKAAKPSDPNPQAPWDFRAEQKAKAKAKKLNALPSVQSASVKLAVPGAKTTIIQICDWHLIGAKEFLAQYDGEPLEPEEAVKLYEQHLADVEAVQKEQVALLRAILDKFKVRAVFQENLTSEQVKPYKLLADVLAKHEGEPKYREAILRHGATGKLYRDGKIKEVLPLEDEAAWKNANPVKDGTVQIDKAAMEKREDAQVAALLKQSGIVVVLLGGAHDLTDNLQRAGAKAEYLRVEGRAYRKVVSAY